LPPGRTTVGVGVVVGEAGAVDDEVAVPVRPAVFFAVFVAVFFAVFFAVLLGVWDGVWPAGVDDFACLAGMFSRAAPETAFGEPITFTVPSGPSTRNAG
jgi:hypothetical protein